MPLPIIDPDQLAITAEERRVIELCNQHRAAAGLPPLGVSLSANRAAAWKSVNMSQTGYFSHNDPDGRTFAQRMRDLEVAGNSQRESIAAGYRDPDAVMAGWMGSVGHKGNILAPDMKSIGVAVADNPNSTYGRYWTQVFSNAPGDEGTEPPPPPAAGPVITSVTPASGIVGQTVTLTITGTGFGHDSAVWFGYKPTTVIRLSDTSLSAHVPAASIPVPGPYAVIVMSGGKQSPDWIWTATQPGPPPDPPVPPGDDARQQTIDALANARKQLDIALELVQRGWRA